MKGSLLKCFGIECFGRSFSETFCGNLVQLVMMNRRKRTFNHFVTMSKQIPSFENWIDISSHCVDCERPFEEISQIVYSKTIYQYFQIIVESIFLFGSVFMHFQTTFSNSISQTPPEPFITLLLITFPFRYHARFSKCIQ